MNGVCKGRFVGDRPCICCCTDEEGSRSRAKQRCGDGYKHIAFFLSCCSLWFIVGTIRTPGRLWPWGKLDKGRKGEDQGRRGRPTPTLAHTNCLRALRACAAGRLLHPPHSLSPPCYLHTADACLCCPLNSKKKPVMIQVQDYNSSLTPFSPGRLGLIWKRGGDCLLPALDHSFRLTLPCAHCGPQDPRPLGAAP